MPYDDFPIVPQRKIHTRHLFYQIATFSHNNLYHVRKYIFDSTFEQMSYKDYWLKKKQLDKLMNTRQHQYKCYPAYNLDEIDHPKTAELMVASSEILSVDYDYSGFAPF